MSTSPLAELHEALKNTSKSIEGKLDRLSEADAKAARQYLDAIADVLNEETEPAAFADVCDEVEKASDTIRRLMQERTRTLPIEKLKRVGDKANYFDPSRRSQSQE